MIEIVSTIPRMTTGSEDLAILERRDALVLGYRTQADETSAVLRFDGLRDWNYGYPNDEALEVHPRSAHGLEPYEFHVTPKGRFGERAWMATFHEGTLTVYAESVVVLVDDYGGSPAEAVRAVLRDHGGVPDPQ